MSNSISVGRIGWHKCPDNERKAHAFHWTEWSHGPHDPLWSDELLEQIQIVRRRQLRGSNGGSLHNVYPLRRITICDRRNRTMYGEAPRSTLYIACGNQRERHDSGQSAVRRSRHGDQVGEWLTSLHVPDDCAQISNGCKRRLATAQEQRPTVDVSRIEGPLANLRELLIGGDITREEHVGRSRALKATLSQLCEAKW